MTPKRFAGLRADIQIESFLSFLAELDQATSD
jgi:hypothetical protein